MNQGRLRGWNRVIFTPTLDYEFYNEVVNGGTNQLRDRTFLKRGFGPSKTCAFFDGDGLQPVPFLTGNVKNSTPVCLIHYVYIRTI